MTESERIKQLERALIKTGASLAAAISLLENGGRKAAASDKMFEIMLEDYRAALSEARALLKEADQ
jgi:DNA-binding ferritin-like protein